MSASAEEFDFIDWIRRRMSVSDRVSLGIGDDTAWIRTESVGCLVTSDMLLEGVHFTCPEVSPELVGRKSLAVNLSDIAAMAGRPTSAYLSLALPGNRGVEFARQLVTGFVALAEEFSVTLAGGDTNAWNGPAVIAVTLLGDPPGTGPIRRSAAEVGDWIMLTGSVGGSPIDNRHATFRPRVDEGRQLAATVRLHAMIDVSDGLAADLHHILDESRVGAVVSADAIPVHPAAQRILDGRTPLEHALGDGEDFELLLTVSPDDGQRLLQIPPISTPLTRIGTIVEAPARELVSEDGTRQPLPRSGWVHKL